jgi:diguanylate cyclase (GGDEF)-like protein/PAS domain S-box-containing protein
LIDHNPYYEAVHKNSCAFAYHEAVFDENNRMIDYIFLDVNQSFEELTGLKKEDILNKRYVQDVAQDKDQAMKWVHLYEKVVTEQSTVDFQEYSTEFSRYYSVIAYSSEKSRFVTIFQNKTIELKMQEIAQYFINNIGNQINYDQITKFAYEISGADYAAFNLFHENGRDFSTISLCGVSNQLKKICEMLDFQIIGKTWAYDPEREKRTKDKDITVFETLHDLTGKVLPKTVIIQLENIFKLGITVIAKITREGRVLGDFTLFFKKGQQLKNQNLLLLYISQLSLFMEKNRLDVALQTNQKMFYTLAEYAPIGFISCDTKGTITYANKKLIEIMDSPSYDATRSINLLDFPKLKAAGFSEKLKECMIKDRQISFEMGYTSLWGKYCWLRVFFTPIKENEKIIGANIVVDDITEKKKTEDELKEKVQRDPLTRAFNRHALETILLERINDSAEKKLISCLVVLDVDDFKDINDTYGHLVGDKVLKYLATRIKQELRDDDLIIRTGGDEFLIYFHDIQDEKNAPKFINRLFDKISAEYKIAQEQDGNRHTLHVSCSMGICFYPKDGTSLNVLISKADDALYQVKKSGKGKYAFA